MEAWFLPSSQITGRMYNTDVTVQLVYDVKSVSQLDTVALLGNNRNRVRWVVLCLSQDRACTDLFENFSENSL